jgi:hypothetical protein
MGANSNLPWMKSMSGYKGVGAMVFFFPSSFESGGIEKMARHVLIP